MRQTRVALVSGARHGIGKELARWFLAKGYAVVGCSRKPSRWSLRGYLHFPADVTDEAAVTSMFSEIRRRHGRLDVLVNNAGIAAMNHCLLTPVASVSRILEVNVAGTFLLSREAAKLMARRRYGRIVNMGSVGVPLRLAGEAGYVASKAAVVSLTQVMARELAPLGITVNVVGPTPLDTRMTKNVPREKLRRLASQLPIPRRATFADIANVVEFFIRPESSHITGQVVYLGGG